MKFTALAALIALLPSTAVADGPFKKGEITTFVTFGDSTTDTVRVFNGGVQWPDYVMGYTGVTLYNFAWSGSTCSNALTPRPFNPLVEWQIPTYRAEKANGTITVDPSKTLYSIWMGTNDIGPNSIISASNNASVMDVANCLVGSVKTLYDTGARNFLFHNVSPGIWFLASRAGI
jgi:phospholipase/lecithinase/hemolysin